MFTSKLKLFSLLVIRNSIMWFCVKLKLLWPEVITSLFC